MNKLLKIAIMFAIPLAMWFITPTTRRFERWSLATARFLFNGYRWSCC